MSLTELLAHVGDENLKFQTLRSSLIQANQKKAECHITFATSKEHGQSVMKTAAGIDSDVAGIIVWVPRSKMPDEFAKGL